MTGAAAVLVCALELLGGSASRMPPIELVASPPPDGSPNTEAFVRSGTPIIFVVTSSYSFRNADCDNWRSLVRLASVLVHEEWHVRNGSDERGAYDAQLTAVLRLGGHPHDREYQSIYRAMRTVLAAQKKTAERLAHLEAKAREGKVEGDAPIARAAR